MYTPDHRPIPSACTLCNKPISELHVLSRVEMKIDCYYVRTDEQVEPMNGLGRHTEEYLCEDCFSKLSTSWNKLLLTKNQLNLKIIETPHMPKESKYICSKTVHRSS